MSASNDKDTKGAADWKSPDPTPVPLLEEIRKKGRVWEDLAEQYGVANPDPPWKTSLVGTCEALAEADCLGALDRRASEDDLSENLYQDLPQPERELVALAHTMIRRGLIDEKELARRMEEVNKRLNS
jgi:hypothetical protein